MSNYMSCVEVGHLIDVMPYSTLPSIFAVYDSVMLSIPSGLILGWSCSSPAAPIS